MEWQRNWVGDYSSDDGKYLIQRVFDPDSDGNILENQWACYRPKESSDADNNVIGCARLLRDAKQLAEKHDRDSKRNDCARSKETR
jgi:hypothetical protein